MKNEATFWKTKAKIIDYSILVLLSLFLFILLVDYGLLKLDENHYFKKLKDFSEPILWTLIALFVLDLYVKSRKYDSWKEFFKKHWFDIVTICLIPVFSAMKIVKLLIKLLKQLKILKTIVKLIYKIKKHRSESKGHNSNPNLENE